LWAAELAAGATMSEVGDHLDGDLLGADPLGAYDASANAVAAVFAIPRTLKAPCARSRGGGVGCLGGPRRHLVK